MAAVDVLEVVPVLLPDEVELEPWLLLLVLLALVPLVTKDEAELDGEDVADSAVEVLVDTLVLLLVFGDVGVVELAVLTVTAPGGGGGGGAAGPATGVEAPSPITKTPVPGGGYTRLHQAFMPPLKLVH
mmetsp:Transcript_14208/g.33566  ORF Transcript_14208/g.33566 Transcript_14208/m.33566 type:complete len:129 (-) Transcript_14208:186-572(-)